MFTAVKNWKILMPHGMSWAERSFKAIFKTLIPRLCILNSKQSFYSVILYYKKTWSICVSVISCLRTSADPRDDADTDVDADADADAWRKNSLGPGVRRERRVFRWSSASSPNDLFSLVRSQVVIGRVDFQLKRTVPVGLTLSWDRTLLLRTPFLFG